MFYFWFVQNYADVEIIHDTLNLSLIILKFQRSLLIVSFLPIPLMFLQLISRNMNELISIHDHDQPLRYITSKQSHCIIYLIFNISLPCNWLYKSIYTQIIVFSEFQC